MQEAGAVVVYGVMGYKTHAKMLLFVRREGSQLIRYAHLGTGNYHRKTSLLYTDYSLLTANETLCTDVHKVFQQITGMGKKLHPKLLVHAPFNLRKAIIKLIQQEKMVALEGKPARIIGKMNALTDPAVIKEFYEASQAGVQIDLIVRGTCCLKPGITNVSENIRVVSVVGRFLEHSRVYHFLNAEHSVYCSSADLMERNLSNRIEVCFPILKKKHANRIIEELKVYLESPTQTWELNFKGEYIERSRQENDQLDVQTELLNKLTQT